MSSSRSLARVHRAAPLAAMLLLVVAAVALAQVNPPPPPPPVPVPIGPGVPFIQGIRVGHADCDTCPPFTCLGEPVQVTVSGQVGPCVEFRGLHEVPTRGLFPVVQAEFVVDTCRAACPQLIAPFSGSISLPPQPGGPQTLVVRVAVRTCPDTSVVVDSSQVTVRYEVRTDCTPPPPPVDSLVRTFVKLATSPAHPCAGDSVSVLLVKNGCPPCVHLVSFVRDRAGIDTFAGVVDWAPVCAELRCAPETLSTSMGQLAQGSYRVSAGITVRVLGTANPDSMIAFHVPFEFQVGPPCGGPPAPCVVREMESNVPSPQCALTLPPGTSGDVPLFYTSELAMAGVQGVINVSPPFRLLDLRLAGNVTGAHLSRQRDGVSMRWLVFTDPGVVLPPGARQHLLDATIEADSTAHDGQSGLMPATITLAAGPGGEALPLCQRETLVIVATRLCVGEHSACDVNHDGRLDVRDLVRMVGCLRHDLVDSTGACVDCDSSGVFDINDIFCCAGDILRGPGVPRDSVQSDAAVSVGVDPIEALGSGDLLVRVRVHGARALGAAMLRFDYPGTRWRAALPIGDRGGARPVDADWYPIIDVSQPGRIDVGGLRLGDTGADEFVFDVVMSPLGQPTSPGRLDVVAVDLAARNGSVVTPMGALPSVVLEPGATSGGTAVELSPARPNPFNGSTTFAIRLPASAPMDLAVHDIAGRRVATLAHGVYGAGEHSFSWDGAGVHDGLYFVRLTVSGQVLSTRVALLRDSRQ